MYRYNSRNHPMPFMKASNVIAPAKSTTVKPDLEEAFEEEDDGQETPEVVVDEEAELKKDKFIKMPKEKKAAAGKKGAGKKNAAKGDDEDEDLDLGESVKTTKKGKGRATAAKGKGKK